MVYSVSIFPPVFRADSTILPVVEVTDASDTPFVKIGDWQYFSLAVQNPKTILPLNRTQKIVPVIAKDCFSPATDWDLDAGVTQSGTDVERTSGEGYQGGVYNTTPLAQNNCSIQAKITSTVFTSGISLQDESDTPSHVYTDALVRHSILLAQGGQGSIRENGEFVSTNAFFKYVEGDTVMIEIIDGICRYFLIKEDGRMQLLRQTRSKLTEDAQAEFLLYFDGSKFEDIYLFSDTAVETSFESIGVAYFRDFTKQLYWQAFGNQKAGQSIGEPIELADKRVKVTYPNQKRRVNAWNLTPKAFSTEEYWLFQEFVEFHDIAKEFLFRDFARKRDGEATEYWVKFTQAFVDATRNGCQFEQSQSILEDFRSDYIPRSDDTTPPEVEIVSIEEGSAVITGTASDNVMLYSLQLYKNGVKYGDTFLPDEAGDWEITVPSGDLNPGSNPFYVIATDYAGNTTQSNTMDFYVDVIPPTVAITAPTAGQVISGSFLITANATDNVAVDRVEWFYYDGAGFAPLHINLTAPYQYLLNTHTFPNGELILAATAFDVAGNASTPDFKTAEISNDTPSGALTFYGEPITFYGEPITFTP